MTNPNIIATVDGRTITAKEADAYLRRMDPRMAQQFQTPAGRNRLRDELIQQELLFLDAREAGIDQDEEFVEQLDKMKENMLKQYAMNKIMRSITVTDAEVKDYYLTHEEDFTKPVTIKASHILLEDGEKSQQIYNEIQSGSITFEDAAEKSTCEGVDLGHFTKGKMVPAFEEVAFALAVGGVSAPVKTEFGYHIIKVHERTVGEGKAFDEVKDELKQQLLMEKQQATFYGKINALRDKYKVE